MTLVEVKPPLFGEIRKFGADDVNACINCGTCTAICNLIDENDGSFPRNIIRAIQLGQKEKILESTDPWMCYYCGDCSATCPKGANPGEIMMGVRRYQTAEYDITGQGKRIYTSQRATFLAVLVWFLGPILYLSALHLLGFGKVVTSRVELNSFAPVEIINITAHIYAIYLSTILIGGMIRMWRNVINKRTVPNGVKLSDYVAEVPNVITNGFTVREWLKCGQQRLRWLKHYVLALGYVTMFGMIVLFLRWFQTDNIYPITHPQRWIGYLATIGIIIGTTDALIGRLRKRNEMHKHSTHTDWMFPLSVLLVTLTGILVHILRYVGLPWPTYIVYAIHLGFTCVMLSTEVGIGKWTHIFYRPLGLYLDGVKKRANARRLNIK